jgi:hypothetical protein
MLETRAEEEVDRNCDGERPRMKILKREIDKRTHEGWIKVRPEEDEDLWHLYHLIRIGDGIKATAIR